MSTRIALALGPREWESRLTAQLVHPSTDVTVVRRCVDGDDARTTLPLLKVDAVIVSDSTARIDSDFIDMSRACGIRVLAVSDDAARWTALGVREVFPLAGTDVVTCGRAIAAALAADVPTAAAPPRGTGVCVAGFGGAAGRTSVTRELGFAMARLDGSSRVLLADADVYSPSLAQQLGLRDAGGGLLAACRAAEASASRDSVADSTIGVADRLDVLSGLARATRWADLSRHQLDAVWRECLSAYSVVVADAGPVLEPDNSGRASSRAAAAHSLLAASESVALCCRADTLGVTRLVRGYAECEGLLSDKHITVVVVGATSRSREKDVDNTLIRLTGLQSIVHIASRPDVFDRADREGGFASNRDKETARAFERLARVVLPSGVVTPREISTRAIDDYLRAA